MVVEFLKFKKKMRFYNMLTRLWKSGNPISGDLNCKYLFQGRNPLSPVKSYIHPSCLIGTLRRILMLISLGAKDFV